MIAAVVLLAFANVCAYEYLKPALPDVDTLRVVQLQVPLRVYTRDGRLIASIGEQRRIPVRYEQIPPKLVQAFLAAEDDRFFTHHGIDWQGILRAALKNIWAGGVHQGGSTITQQVARDMFLGSERKLKRKMSEIYISFMMEAEFSKEEIFSLFANKTFLGERAYGVAAAAEVYYGKTLDQLSIAEMATIAGIPSAPSKVNPVANPEAARNRRAYVLRRMLEIGAITQAEHDEANASPVESRLHSPTAETDAPYVAEMVRAEMQSKYGDSAYTAGYKVYTTIDSRLEQAATIALRTGLLEYDRRHGFRGPTAKVELPKSPAVDFFTTELEQFPLIGGLRPAIVRRVDARSAEIFVKDLGVVDLAWDKLSWARRELPEEKVGPAPTQATQILAPGDVIYTVGNSGQNLQFVQVPEAQSALVSLDPKDGAVTALVGGFDYFQSKFNRVTQARRQPGSSFKPFVYSAAFDKGYTPASVVLDAPIVVDEADAEKSWRPKEDAHKFFGPTRLREALIRSRNLVSIRLMRDIGGEYTRNYVTRFGFDKSQLPDDLTLALGTAELSPLQMAVGYATFANGGYHVNAYTIDRIEDATGQVLFQAEPLLACFECSRPAPAANRGPHLDSGDRDGKSVIPEARLAPQVLRPQVAYLLADMMADVIRRGTGVRARALNRDDVAGKTGTSNNYLDAWFSGFNGDLVATVWVGFDSERTLGELEEGGRVAVPIWTYFMHDALAGAPRHGVPVPDGIVTVRIAPDTGYLASADNPNGIMEKFIEGSLPKAETYEGPNNANPMSDGDKPLF
jgi:penicillin-binding protein 1A